MSITHVGTVSAPANSGADPFAVSVPAGTAENDIIIALIASDDGDEACNIPSGFTSIFAGPAKKDSAGSTLDAYVAFGYKIAGSSEPGSYDFGHVNGGEPMAAALMVFRGVDTTNPLDVTPVTAERYEADDVNRECPAITTVTDGAAIVCVLGMELETSIASTEAGFSVIVDQATNSGFVSSGASVQAAWKIHPVAGTGGPYTFVGSDDFGDSAITGTIALRAIPSAGVTMPNADADASAAADSSLSIKVGLSGNAEATATATGAIGVPEPLAFIEAASGVSGGSGTISIDAPVSMAAGDLIVGLIASDNGALANGLPAGFTSLDRNPVTDVEAFVQHLRGTVNTPPSGQTIKNAAFGGGRVGVVYAGQPTFEGQVAIYQDAAGTIPADTIGDPVLYLVDFSGNGYDAIQASGPAGLTLAKDGDGEWCLQADQTQNRPIIPAAAFTNGQRSTLTLAFFEEGSDNSILLGAQGDNSSFFFASLDGSGSTTINGNVTYDNIRVEDTGEMVDIFAVPTTRDGNFSVITNHRVATWEGIEFSGTFATNDVILLGYNASGWEPEGKFYGMVLSSSDLVGLGVDRGDGVKAFYSQIGYKQVDGSEESFDFTHDAAESAVAGIALYRNHDPLKPLDISLQYLIGQGLEGAVSDDDRDIPEATTVTDGAFVIHAIANEGAISAHAPPTGVTEVIDVDTGTGADGAAIAMGYEQINQAGLYAPDPWTATTTTDTAFKAYSLVIKPQFEFEVTMEGSASASAAAEGDLTPLRALSGSAAAQASASGNVSIGAALKGSAAGEATATAGLGRKAPVAGSAQAASFIEATLDVYIGFSGSASVSADASSDPVYAKTPLSGSATATAASEADLLINSTLDAQISATASASGDLFAKQRLLAAVTGQAEASGEFIIKRGLSPKIARSKAFASGGLIRSARLFASVTAKGKTTGFLESFANVYFEASVGVSATATSPGMSLLTTYSEDVITMGLVSIIDRYGGKSGYQTIKLNPPNNVLKVSRESPH